MSLLEIVNALQKALSAIHGISYSINSKQEEQGYCSEIEFNYDKFAEDVDTNWREDVDKALSDVSEEYGGSYYDVDNSIVYSIPE